jgi:hypothetical protein
MSIKDERRRFERYPLRLPIKLTREGEELAADVINASEGGCLLLVSAPMVSGDVLEASIPLLRVPRTKLHVLRCQPADEGKYTVATCFEERAGDASAMARLSEEQGQQSEPQEPSPRGRTLH